MWFLIGCLGLVYGHVNSQSFSSCVAPTWCDVDSNQVFKLCPVSEWEGAWVSRIKPWKNNQICTEGVSFGRVGRYIWATKICHGSFDVCTTGMHNYGIGKCFTPFTCNGEDYKECIVGPEDKTFVTVVEVREQLSETSYCNQKTFGRKSNLVWTTKECKAVFTVCYANEYDVKFTNKRCKGNCKIDNAGNIVSIEVLKTYHSPKMCKKLAIPRNTDSGFIFMGECEADLRVGFVPEKYYITCTSKDNGNTTCTDGKSMPATFYLHKEFSNDVCERGKTYGSYEGFYDAWQMGPEVWVSGGCSAKFVAFPRLPI